VSSAPVFVFVGTGDAGWEGSGHPEGGHADSGQHAINRSDPPEGEAQAGEHEDGQAPSGERAKAAARREADGDDAPLGVGGGSEEAELVALCRAGDPTAFRQLFREHRQSVARLVHRMTGGSSELEDLVQEVFVQVHKSLGSFRREARLGTWIYRIAINVVLMHRRSQRSRPSLVPAPADPGLVDEDQPDEQLARRRRVAALYRLLDRMSEKKRTVYVLHELEGLTPAEISQVVGAPVLTVRTRLFYARRTLMAELAREPALAALAESLGSISDPAPPGREPHQEPA
jgi:RNA polymerase sigma-70 factor (ECF subfamily)